MEAKVSNLSRVFDLLKQFIDELDLEHHGFRYVKEDWTEHWQSVINKGQGQIFIAKNPKRDIIGAIGGYVSTTNEDKTLVMAEEAFWYVSKEHRKSKIGINLLNEFSSWAKSKGASQLIMVNLSQNNSVSRLYKSEGFKELQTSWIKDL